MTAPRPRRVGLGALSAAAAIVVVLVLVTFTGPVGRPVEAGRPAAPTDHPIALVDGGASRPLRSDEVVELARGLSATFRLVPQGGGEQLLRLGLQDAAGRPVADATVTAVVEMRFMEHGRSTSTAEQEAPGTYLIPVTLAMSGEWQLTLAIRAGTTSATVRLDFDDFR